MEEVLKALGLTPPVIAIIVALCGVLWFICRNMVQQLYKMSKDERDAIKADLQEIKAGMDELKKNDKTQNQAIVQVIYHQCLAEALKWKEQGHIDSSAKLQFNYRWTRYLELGDGLGEEPKTIVDALPIVE